MPTLNEMPRVFWAGDSTVKQNDFTSFPQCGIGQGFPLYIKKEIMVINRAENGRSTKSFIDEGRLDYIKENIRKGDFLFIQFGHNDEKPDAERYTEPWSTFQENLKIYIDVAKDAGAYPLLITPLYRRIFVAENKLTEKTHLDYPDAMIKLGEELNVPVVDLCEISRKLIENTGDTDSRKWFMYFPEGMYEKYPEGKSDNTHLRYDGAVKFAGIIANELKKIGGVYADLLVDADSLKEDPALLVD